MTCHEDIDDATKFLQACTHLTLLYNEYSPQEHMALMLACIHLSTLTIVGSGTNIIDSRDRARKLQPYRAEDWDTVVPRAQAIARNVLLRPGFNLNPATVLHYRSSLYTTHWLQINKLAPTHSLTELVALLEQE